MDSDGEFEKVLCIPLSSKEEVKEWKSQFRKTEGITENALNLLSSMLNRLRVHSNQLTYKFSGHVRDGRIYHFLSEEKKKEVIKFLKEKAFTPEQAKQFNENFF